jgi:hypothetical protein
MRDIAHSGPYLIKAALRAMETDVGAIADSAERQRVENMMGDYAKRLARFIHVCAGEDRPQGEHAKRDAFVKAGLLNAPEEATRLFGKWLARAVLGFYFSGIGAALHKGESPLGVDGAVKALEGLYNDNGTD